MSFYLFIAISFYRNIAILCAEMSRVGPCVRLFFRNFCFREFRKLPFFEFQKYFGNFRAFRTFPNSQNCRFFAIFVFASFGKYEKITNENNEKNDVQLVSSRLAKTRSDSKLDSRKLVPTRNSTRILEKSSECMALVSSRVNKALCDVKQVANKSSMSALYLELLLPAKDSTDYNKYRDRLRETEARP
jgi:hypothetical protein